MLPEMVDKNKIQEDKRNDNNEVDNESVDENSVKKYRVRSKLSTSKPKGNFKIYFLYLL